MLLTPCLRATDPEYYDNAKELYRLSLRWGWLLWLVPRARYLRRWLERNRYGLEAYLKEYGE